MLVLYAAALRDAGGATGFSAFALSLPTLFALVHLLDLRGGAELILRIDPQIIALLVATAWIGLGTWRQSMLADNTRPVV
jgi:hypothetical protein